MADGWWGSFCCKSSGGEIKIGGEKSQVSILATDNKTRQSHLLDLGGTQGKVDAEAHSCLSSNEFHGSNCCCVPCKGIESAETCRLARLSRPG